MSPLFMTSRATILPKVGFQRTPACFIPNPAMARAIIDMNDFIVLMDQAKAHKVLSGSSHSDFQNQWRQQLYTQRNGKKGCL